MKHTIILSFFLLIASIASAQQIPTEFLGLKMGKTTFDEAERILKNNGHSTMVINESILMSWGKSTIYGVNADAMVSFFALDGKLFMVLLVDSCDSWDCNKYCEDIITPIHKKYNSLIDFPDEKDNLSFYKQLLGIENASYWGKYWEKRNEDYTAQIFTLVPQDKKVVVVGYGYLNKDDLIPFDPANEVTSVAGCKFGDAKSDVSNTLKKRFGSPLDEDDKVMTYYNIEIGGTLYEGADFYFRYNPKTRRSEFVSAKFQKHFNTWEEDNAKAMYDAVVSQYGRKYTNLESGTLDDGLIYSRCGSSQQYPLPIFIYMEKSLSKGGDMYYYVVVEYFSQAIQGLYDDDI